MIYLTKGQPLFNNEGMVVCDPTGYYEDGATVVCAVFHSPDVPVCRYEAKYIAYGDQVYNITDENKLMEEIIKIDPESLLGKTNADVVIDNLVNEIKTVENPTPELTQELVDTNNSNVNNPNTSNTNIGTTTTETTTYDPDVGTTTETVTTTVENVTPEVSNPVIEAPEVVSPVIDVPVVETPVVVPEVPSVPEVINSTVLDQPVSQLNNFKKIV